VTLLAYRFALDPTPAQERALRSHAGAARVAFNWGLGQDQLSRALKNWAGSRSGKRKGKPVGFPRFKAKRKARPSIRFTTGAFGCEAGHAVLPRIGQVKLHENGTRLVDLVAVGTARVASVSVRQERGRWHASFTVDTETTRPAPTTPDAVVGGDLGIKTLAVLSTGETIPNPHHLTKALRKVRRRSRTVSRRQDPDRRTRAVPSNRWRRASAALAKAQGRVADQRRDALHKATTSLTARFGTLIVADRWFASSKTCSGCGTAKAKLALSERTYGCTTCGLVLDRDINAARNLAEYGKQHLAASGADSNGRRADRKTRATGQVAVKLEAPPACGGQPGTRRRGETGIIPSQDGTAA
jgi:putative transposase